MTENRVINLPNMRYKDIAVLALVLVAYIVWPFLWKDSGIFRFDFCGRIQTSSDFISLQNVLLILLDSVGGE